MASWHLQQINNSGNPTVPGEFVATSGPPAASLLSTQLFFPASIFVSVYNDQQHFAYVDSNGNIQDAWYDGPNNVWKLQQINNATGPTNPGEYVATNGPAAAGNLFVSVFQNQQHFAYIDGNGNIQDAWYNGDANVWNLQQINNANGAPTVVGEYVATNGPPASFLPGVFVSVYGNQQHFTYSDNQGNLQDAWYDGDTNSWNLQQINNANGTPPIPGEYVATNGPSNYSFIFVSTYNNQQHFSYLDQFFNLQDAWYNGDTNAWNLQQINNANGQPTVAGEYIATNGPALYINSALFVSVYHNQQHFVFTDYNSNIQDAWYDGDTSAWSLQQINNALGPNPTIPGEFMATNGPPFYSNLFVSVYGDQQHFTYLDAYLTIHDAWYDGDKNVWNLQQINNNGVTKGPEFVGNLFVSVYNEQQHFVYLDINGNIQDAWYG